MGGDFIAANREDNYTRFSAAVSFLSVVRLLMVRAFLVLFLSIFLGPLGSANIGIAQAQIFLDLGDMNRDTLIDLADVEPFTLALTNPASYYTMYGVNAQNIGDTDSDGDCDVDDIDDFAQILGISGNLDINQSVQVQSIPEPVSGALLLIASLVPFISLERTLMVRAFLLLFVSLSCGPVWAANFWISKSNDLCIGQSCSHLNPPTSQVESKSHLPTDTQGTFYIWARPDGIQNLGVWGLNVRSSNPSVVSLSLAQDAVDVYNPSLGTLSGVQATRWESYFEPSGTTYDDFDNEVPTIEYYGIRGTALRYHGFLSDPRGLGIGPGNSDGSLDDTFYNPATNSWLLASVKYNIHGTDGQSASIYLQIAENGISQDGQDSSFTDVVFGSTMDDELNAHANRSTDSETADYVVNISSGIPGDFNTSGKVDGRDLLLWQRNPALGSLNDWQTNYGTSQLTAAVSVPEPSMAIQLSAFLIVTNWQWRRRYSRGARQK